ncbi:retrovirus-related pol polyprotein from transposon 297 [Plakobranchus ocellatus]|uniref:Retrovirus-related pol polyprotein from transposon 297 n=1 Tax=Plakobranchus ocellatus TaxID=259542 RepID=A0AAV4A1J0_9GAST|nr:retrovirus-related pol polyprotein from transposon 297 [Plakobranchus ocellatus]
MPCRYASRKLLPREGRYSVIEREALALVFAVTQFQRYSAFNHFILQTDHKPLSYLRAGSPENARLMRWLWLCRNFRFRSFISLDQRMSMQTCCRDCVRLHVFSYCF